MLPLNIKRTKVTVCSRGRLHPNLSFPCTKKCVDFEHELMTYEIKQIIKEKLEENKGIIFRQYNNDLVKSAKGAKF